MNQREKERTKHVLRFYCQQLQKAFESGDLLQAEMCRQRLWGAALLAEQLKAMTPTEVNKVDAWADDMIFALRREYYTAGGEEIPCRERT